MDILQKIEHYQRQESELSRETNFLNYLKLVKKNPRIARSAHSRIYEMIAQAGIQEEQGLVKYKFFAGELFGLDSKLHTLVQDYFRAAAMGFDLRKRILLLVGPVGGGKSTIVNLLKKGLELYTRSDEGVLYGIKHCPMHEEPLHLIPLPLRKELEQELGVKVEGSLCPSCQMMLKERYAGCIQDVIVEGLFSQRKKELVLVRFALPTQNPKISRNSPEA